MNSAPFLLFDLLRGRDPYLADAALTALARQSVLWTPKSVLSLPDKDRVWALVVGQAALGVVGARNVRWQDASGSGLEARAPLFALEWRALSCGGGFFFCATRARLCVC